MLFFALNALATAATLELGLAWYGYGYFVSCVIAACASAFITIQSVNRLPFMTFISNNPAVTRI
jgi:uncharacterized membrane protein